MQFIYLLLCLLTIGTVGWTAIRWGAAMAKAISILLLLAMVVHIIRPLGLPGLRKRGDFWKIALVALAVMMLTVLIRPA